MWSRLPQGFRATWDHAVFVFLRSSVYIASPQASVSAAEPRQPEQRGFWQLRIAAGLELQQQSTTPSSLAWRQGWAVTAVSA